jgi:hypothetical protein
MGARGKERERCTALHRTRRFHASYLQEVRELPDFTVGTYSDM